MLTIKQGGPYMPENKKSQNNSSLLNFNASWITMLIYIIYLGGMIFLQRYIYNSIFNGVSGLNYYVFIFVAFLIGVIFGAIMYNLFKILGAKISGYEIIYSSILGFVKDHPNKKTTFKVLSVADFSLKFAPKDNDLKKNPRKIFWFGLIGEVIFFAIGLIMFFVMSLNKKADVTSFIGYMGLFASIYSLIMPLYEFIPFRQDKPTDFFNLANTKSDDEVKCYNIYHANLRNELTGDDFIVPDLDEYVSYYPVHTLYYVYLDKLYKNELEAAATILDKMKSNLKKFDENERYLPLMESMYLRYLIGDVSGADKVYLTMKGEDKSNVIHPQELGDYRTAISIFHYISKDSESYKKACDEFEAKANSLKQSNRVLKEKELFNAVKTSIEKE